MKQTPEIDAEGIKAAGEVIHRAESAIMKYAEEIGLPITSVYVDHDGFVRVDCGRRVFLSFNGHRISTSHCDYIGPSLWEALAEAAEAYKKRKAA